ncbi:MAG TPA: hypothetical protein VEV41_15200 [Terriglobales bacterium]|nr:hypothetical protein [Terriglobales bacterium]
MVIRRGLQRRFYIAPSKILLLGLASVLTSCGGGSTGPPPPPPNPVPSLASISPPSEIAGGPAFTLTVNGSNFIPASTVQWNGSNRTTAYVNATQLTASISAADIAAAGTSGITVFNPAPGGGTSSSSSFRIISAVGRYRVPNVGVWAYFDDRGFPNGYYPGQVIQNWDQFDSSVGTTVSQEISLQLDKMHAMGVNTVTFDIRAADNVSGQTQFLFPSCYITPATGFQYPQPTSIELTNFPKFLDMVLNKGMKVFLVLDNTHMDETTPANWQTWLGAILGVAGNHPAIDLIMFGGSLHGVDTDGDGTPDACGIPAEPPLWWGSTNPVYQYVKWAIGYASSLGVPARKLSAESIVGSYNIEVQQPTTLPYVTGGHLWQPVAMLKSIFDSLNIPQAQRTYALSFYEQNKCRYAGSLPCTDERADAWADETAANNMNIIGNGGARVVMEEFGNTIPVDAAVWSSPHAFENLAALMEKYGIEGGCYYLWAESDNNLDTDPTQGLPIKKRGLAWNYTASETELLDLGGYHLTAIPNASFEDAAVNGGAPPNWSVSGDGNGSLYLLTQEAGQPEVATRGNFALRLVNGTSPMSKESVTSLHIGVSPNTGYTTTANLRFAFFGDPNPSGTPSTRPRVSLMISYYTANLSPSGVRSSDEFSWFQENSTSGFATFPVQYTTPSDAAFVAIQFGIFRENLPMPITVDVDNVR